MFNLDSVPNICVKEAVLGDIEIIKDSPRGFVLYNKGLQWMVLDTHSNREVKELYSSYDLAYGDVLLSGLGFGVLALWLCEKPEVTSVTVIELSEDIITLFTQSNTPHEKLSIVNEDINSFFSTKKYDCLLLDHYEHERFSWRIKNMQSIAKNIPHNLFWAWSLEEMYAIEMYKLTKRQLNETYLYFNYHEFGGLWDIFRDEVIKIPTIPHLSAKKVDEYVYTYFDRIGYSPTGWAETPSS